MLTQKIIKAVEKSINSYQDSKTFVFTFLMLLLFTCERMRQKLCWKVYLRNIKNFKKEESIMHCHDNNQLVLSFVVHYIGISFRKSKSDN